MNSEGPVRPPLSLPLQVIVLALVLRGAEPTPIPELPRWFGDASLPDQPIQGHVIGARGPVTVALLLDVGDPLAEVVRRETTHADGAFAFAPTRPGHYLVMAYSDKQMSRALEVDTQDGDASALDVYVYDRASLEAHAFELYGTGFWPAERLLTRMAEPFHGAVPAWQATYTGRVVDAAGAPVPGVGVQPFNCGDFSAHPGERPPEAQEVHATTDPTGRFYFRYWADQRWCGFRVYHGPSTQFVRVRPDEIAPTVTVPGVEEYLEVGRIVVEDPGAWVFGRVLFKHQPVADVSIRARAWTDDGAAETLELAVTHSDGSFSMYLPPGVLRSPTRDHDPTIELVHVPGRWRRSHELQIRAGGTARGMILTFD